MRYNHAIDFAAEIVNDSPDDVTAEEARKALLHRIHSLSDAELLEAIDIFDTHEEDRQ